jgi:hypothetical protein
LQKHQFKSNPQALIWGKKPEIIKGEGSSQLLVSGWWGVARKVNYTGDLIMAFAMGAVCYDVTSFFFFCFVFLTFLADQCRSLPLRSLSYDAAHPQAKSRRRMVPRKVRQGLGRVQTPCSIQIDPVRLLMSKLIFFGSKCK